MNATKPRTAATTATLVETEPDPVWKFEEASIDAKKCAAVLAKYFELEATQHNEDTVAMFAAMGHEDLARDIIKSLDMMCAVVLDMRRRDDREGA